MNAHATSPDTVAQAAAIAAGNPSDVGRPRVTLHPRRANAEPLGHLLDRVVTVLAGPDHPQPQVQVPRRGQVHLRGQQIMNLRTAAARTDPVPESDRRRRIAPRQGSTRRTERPDPPHRGAA